MGYTIVFVIAGQSNSVGYGSVTLGEANLDCVMASAQTDVNKCSSMLPIYPVLYSLGNSSTSKISPNGDMPWAYKRLGNRIADKEAGKVIPTLFFNTGVSGTSAENWSSSANNPSIVQGDAFGVNRCSGTTNGNSSGTGEPFRTFRNTLNYYGSLFGLRGIIWHQGESDTKISYFDFPSYAVNDYVSRVNFLIQKSRDFFNANLLWAVSNVSMYARDTSPNYPIYTSNDKVIPAQMQIRSGTNVAAGALSSDTFIDWSFPANAQGNNNGTVTSGVTANKRQGDRQHFANAGLIDLANNYYDNFITANFGLLNRTPVPANPIVPVIITQVGSSKSVALDFAAIGKVSTDFTCYQWTQGDNYTNATYPPSNCGGYSPLTVSSNGNWRCYMQDSKGNVYTTQKLFINTNPNFRVSESIINSKVYPNPTIPEFENTIEFTLDRPSNVRLEIVDINGNLLQTITDNSHDMGKFQYPFTLKKSNFKDFDTLYYRITIDDTTETKKIILSN